MTSINHPLSKALRLVSALALLIATMIQAVSTTSRRTLARRVPAISGHMQEIIWAVIIVVLGLVAYAFFGNGGAGATWFHNILNSVTTFTD